MIRFILPTFQQRRIFIFRANFVTIVEVGGKSLLSTDF